MFVEHNEKVLPHLISLFLSLRRGDWRQPNVSPHKIKTDRVSVPETFSRFSFFTSPSFFLMNFFFLLQSLFSFFLLIFSFPLYLFVEETSVSASVLSLCKDLLCFPFNILSSWNASRTVFRYFTSFVFLFLHYQTISRFLICFSILLFLFFFVCACAHVKEVSFFILLIFKYIFFLISLSFFFAFN